MTAIPCKPENVEYTGTLGPSSRRLRRSRVARGNRLDDRDGASSPKRGAGDSDRRRVSRAFFAIVASS